MCGKSPKTQIPATPKPVEPVAPLVSASEVDDAELNRTKGLNALKVKTTPTTNSSGLNIP